MANATVPHVSTHAPPPRPVELKLSDEPNTIEIWRDGQQLGMIEATPAGFRVVLGDADVGGGLAIQWQGDPISLQFTLGELA